MPRLVLLSAALAVALAPAVVAAQTPIPPAPRDFAVDAAGSDQYEIQAGYLAQVQGQDPRVRAFAATMIQDHERLDQALRKAVTEAGLPQPTAGMSSDEAALLSGLQGLRGAAFDKAYLRQQQVAHAEAAAVTDSFANAGADPTLKKAAQAALPTIQNHLSMAKKLEAELGSS